MSKSAIEWTDETWNPVTGCTKVSAGCKHCYAEREWPRMTKLVPAYAGRDFTDVRCHPERLEQPLRWKRPRKVFVNSMSDLFHPDVPDAFIDRVFAVMALSPQHTFQVLTKRADRMRDYVQECCGRVLDNVDRFDRYNPGQVVDGQYATATAIRTGASWPLPNVWLGASIEDQPSADQRIIELLNTPAAVRWISAEPLLRAVNVKPWLQPKMFGPRALNGDAYINSHMTNRIDWVVVGGESGQNARPMHPDWVRSLRDQCAAACVPFLFKQWGEWAESGSIPKSNAVAINSHGGCRPCEGTHGMSEALMNRVGKKTAGRLLDGVLHDEYPFAFVIGGAA